MSAGQFIEGLREALDKVKDDDWLDYLHDFPMNKADVDEFLQWYDLAKLMFEEVK